MAALGSLLNSEPATIGQLCWHAGSYCAPLSTWHPYTLPYNVLNPSSKEHSGVRFLLNTVKLDIVQSRMHSPWPKSTPSPWARRGGFLLNPQWFSLAVFSETQTETPSPGAMCLRRGSIPQSSAAHQLALRVSVSYPVPSPEESPREKHLGL